MPLSCDICGLELARGVTHTKRECIKRLIAEEMQNYVAVERIIYPAGVGLEKLNPIEKRLKNGNTD